MLGDWALNQNVVKAGDRVTLQHEDGRRYGPVELKTLGGIDPVTLYVRWFDDSIRAAKSLADCIAAGWRVVEFEPTEQLPTEPGVYRIAFGVGEFPGALYALSPDGDWCWYERKREVRMPDWTRLVPSGKEGER